MIAFGSALLKIERAHRQTNNLGKQIRRFFKDGPGYRISFERDTNPRKWRAIFRLVKEPPDNWAVPMGEIIHNLRSALDHLVYEASAPDEDGRPLTMTEFPIYIDESRFRDKGMRKIRGLNPATHALVERYQPFTNTDPTIVPYLWLLQQLSNTDKHRLLNFIRVPYALGDIVVQYEPSGYAGLPVHDAMARATDHAITRITIAKPGARLEDGAEYYSFWTAKPLPADTEMHMNTEIAMQIAFGDATPVASGLPVFETVDGMGRMVALCETSSLS